MSKSIDRSIHTTSSCSALRGAEVQLNGRRIYTGVRQPIDALRFIYESSIRDKQASSGTNCSLAENSALRIVRDTGKGSKELHALHKLMRVHDFPTTPGNAIICSSRSSTHREDVTHGQNEGASTCMESDTPNCTATIDMARSLNNWAESEHAETTAGTRISRTPEQLYRGYVGYLLVQQSRSSIDVMRSFAGHSNSSSRNSIMCGADAAVFDRATCKSSTSGSSYRQGGCSPGEISVRGEPSSITSVQTSQDDLCNTHSSASVSLSTGDAAVLTSPSLLEDILGSNRSTSRDDDYPLCNRASISKECTLIRSGSTGKATASTPTCNTTSFIHKDTSDAASFILDVADTISLRDSEGNIDPNKLWSQERNSVAAETISATQAMSMSAVQKTNTASTSAHSAVNAAMQPLIQRYRRRCDLLQISPLPCVIRTLSFNTAVSASSAAKLESSVESSDVPQPCAVLAGDRARHCCCGDSITTTLSAPSRTEIVSAVLASAPMKINMSYCFGLGEISSFICFLVILEVTPQLRSLSLRHTELNSFCVRALALLIEAHLHNLTLLDIRDNVHVDDVGGLAIQRLLKRCTTLRVVRVSNTSISSRVVKSIHRLVKRKKMAQSDGKQIT